MRHHEMMASNTLVDSVNGQFCVRSSASFIDLAPRLADLNILKALKSGKVCEPVVLIQGVGWFID